MCVKNAGEASCEGIREIEARRHLRTGIVAHLATYGKPREPQFAFVGEQRSLPASLLQGRPAQFFDEKPSPLSYYLLRFVLRFRWPGLTLRALDCIFGAPLRAAAITHRKNRVRSTSMFPFLDYAPTERADDPKITLSAPALHQRRYRIHSEAWFHCSPSVVSSLERSA